MCVHGWGFNGDHITRRTIAYLPAADGLRAIAIAAVFLYHAHTGWLPGGFLGVDLFFAVSGFLITRGLLSEYDQHGRVNLGRFWLRRGQRLLPAAMVFLFLLITAAQAFFPADVRALRGVALAAVGYATNWYLIYSHQPYFETVGRPQLLQHLWSLAVEEQFYLVWPPVLLLSLRIFRRPVVLVGTLLLGVASAVLMAELYRGGTDTSRLYYGTDTHAIGLLFGAAVAFVPPVWRARQDRRFAMAWQAAGTTALVATAFLFVWLGEWRPFLYQGGFALTAVLSVVLIAVATMPGLFAAVLGAGPFRWIGVRSYSIYLWHPPVLAAFASAGFTVPPFVVVGLAAVATMLVADISFRYVETPIRSGSVWRAIEEFRLLRRDTRWTLGAGFSAAIVAVLVGTIFAPAPPSPAYLTVSQISAVLTSTTHPEGTASAPSWVVPRDAVGGSAAEPVSRSIVPVRTPTAGLTVRSLSAVVTATPELSAPALDVTTASTTAAPTPAPAIAAAPRAPQPAAPILAIGDSVMLGAANSLANAFGTIELDAAIGRDAASTLRILRERRGANRLPSAVIVQVGNNGAITRPQIEEMMQLLAEVPRVAIVDLHVPRPWEASNNAMLADAVSKRPNARLVSWHTASESRADLFWDDMHLRFEGAELYVGLIAETLK